MGISDRAQYERALDPTARHIPHRRFPLAQAPSDQEIGRKLHELVAVDHILLNRAKSAALRLVLEGGLTAGREIVDGVVKELGASDPGTLIRHPAVEFDWEKVQSCAQFYSAKLAACEALWQLINNGLLIFGSFGHLDLQGWAPTLSFEPPRGYGGNSGGIPIEGLDVTFPSHVLPAPSLRANVQRILSDGDLFLRDIGIIVLHPLIDESLRESVKCFRGELYLPCLAMLTKALEGAWTIMGAALADYGERVQDPHAQPLLKKLASPFTSLKDRIERVSEYYRKPVCDPIEIQSGIARSAINQALIWSEEVRDSRNVLHLGQAPSVPITYERVAVLLMATIGHFRAMYAVKDAADMSS
jgi:hypothetical protein